MSSGGPVFASGEASSCRRTPTPFARVWYPPSTSGRLALPPRGRSALRLPPLARWPACWPNSMRAIRCAMNLRDSSRALKEGHSRPGARPRLGADRCRYRRAIPCRGHTFEIRVPPLAIGMPRVANATRGKKRVSDGPASRFFRSSSRERGSRPTQSSPRPASVP